MKNGLKLPISILQNEATREHEEKKLEAHRKGIDLRDRRLLLGEILTAIRYNAKALTPDEILAIASINQKRSVEAILDQIEAGEIDCRLQLGDEGRRTQGLAIIRSSLLPENVFFFIDLRYNSPTISLTYYRASRVDLYLNDANNRDEACRLLVVYAEAKAEQLEREQSDSEDDEE